MKEKLPSFLETDFYQRHCQILVVSFEKLLEKPFLEKERKVADLYFSSAVILSHTCDEDPVFNFVNKQALDLFEYSWEQMIGLPSRLSAEPMQREQRQKLLEQTHKFGYIKNYSGVRISASGKRFILKDVILWNLYDNDNYYGQAAIFSKWQYV